MSAHVPDVAYGDGEDFGYGDGSGFGDGFDFGYDDGDGYGDGFYSGDTPAATTITTQEDSMPEQKTQRRVVVVDGGFVYGGDVVAGELDGKSGVYIYNSIMVRYWSSDATWAGVLNGPHEGVILDRLGTTLFVDNDKVGHQHIVSDNWGRK